MGYKSSYEMIFFAVLFFFVWVAEADPHGPKKLYNVLRYGAVADGKTDNSEAFLKAWNEACQWKGRARVWIPQGTYKLESVMFKGPCQGPMAFLIKGVLKGSTDLSKLFTDYWINFRYVDKLTVSGGGTLDGQGAMGWPRNECRKNPNCPPLPTTMRFDFISNGRVHHLRSINSKSSHMVLFECSEMNIIKIKLSAPGDSPNTDGIKIGSSNHIKISRSTIETGDDCIAVLPGSRKINISEVICGPGHGISVGSLGKYDNEDDVEGLTVKNSTFRDTTNGLRIKTWASNYASKVSDITYEDIFMQNVQNPVIIDQQYCPYSSCNQKASSRIEISNVTYKNIWGSSSSKVAVNFQCSKSNPCKNIVMEDINLTAFGFKGQLSSSCNNTYGVSYGRQNPPACI